MFNVCIMGASLTTGNMGVSALASSLIKLILNVRPDASITFFIAERTATPQELILSDKKVQINVANIRRSPKAIFGEHMLTILFLALLFKICPFQSIKNFIIAHNNRLQTISKADFIGDVRGGDSFSDIYGVSGFLLGSIPSLVTLFLGKRLVLLPQTYGPYSSRISKILAKYILSRAHLILSRDKESIALVEEMLAGNYPGKQPLFCPDVAFALDSIQPKEGTIKPYQNDGTTRCIIGLNINGLLYNGGYTRSNMFNLKMDYKTFVHKLSKAILDNTDANLLLIPHTFAPHGHVESDPDACREVFSELSGAYKNRIQTIEGQYDQHEIKGIIGQCDFFIGSRMHACIAALSQRIPTIGVAYSKKFKGVFNSVGVGDLVVDARDTDTPEAMAMIMNMIQNTEQLKNRLHDQIEAAQMQQTTIFQNAVMGKLAS